MYVIVSNVSRRSNKSKGRTLFMRTAIVMGMLASLSAIAAGSADDVVAKMGANEIKRSELDKMLSDAVQANGPETPPSAQAIDQALRAELIRRALLEEAKRAAWDKRPEVQQQIERAREQVIVTSFINQQARPASSYPSQLEIQAAYDANKALFMQPPKIRLMQIFLPPATDSAEKAEYLWKRANERGADFAELARKYSKHAASAAKGGDMGWLQEDLLVPEIRLVTQKLAVGEIAKPIKAADGWHILKVVERKSAAQKTLAEVRDSLVQSMRLKKAQENEQQYLNQLVVKTPITVNEIAPSSLAGSSK